MIRYCCRYCGDLHTRGATPDNCKEPPPNRSHLPAPYIQNDNLPGYAMRSMADGRVYTSKGKYYQGVKDAGCEMIGNERSHTPSGYRPPNNFMTEKRSEQIAAEGLQRHEQETGEYFAP